MMLLPDRLRKLWEEVTAGHRSQEDFAREQEQLLQVYRSTWGNALLSDGETDLRTSLLYEISACYDIPDLAQVDRYCSDALVTLRREWDEKVDAGHRASIENFYESPTTVYELMEWHSLRDDTGPLAYVLGLDIARSYSVQSCLDFGSGVGSGALLFMRAGLEMTLADISTTLLNFARWRIAKRGLRARFVDLKYETIPAANFDMILAMDVFEHLVDPAETVERLWRALKPGGLLFARIHAEIDPNRPQHIARNFGPTFARMEKLGLVEKWADKWLWGHQLFQKT
jgi:2-polyprenyl-3-methyl-5-hydroxy-6-metoxy-1,4-benzoquinol methylase